MNDCLARGGDLFAKEARNFSSNSNRHERWATDQAGGRGRRLINEPWGRQGAAVYTPQRADGLAQARTLLRINPPRESEA
jgi:hypothetical protein